jgi:hypothetical protein
MVVVFDWFLATIAVHFDRPAAEQGLNPARE